MIKKSLLGLLLCTTLSSFAVRYPQQTIPKPQNNHRYRIFYSSIVQNGTHLAKRCIELLTHNKQPELWLNSANRRRKDFKHDINAQTRQDRRLITSAPAHAYVGGHLPYTKALADLLRQLGFKKILMIRHPAAHVASRGKKILTHQEQYRPIARHYNLPRQYSQLVSDIIDQVPSLYRNFLRWQEDPDCYVVRFENLVGPKGGGSKEGQLLEIKNIAHHFNIPYDEKLIHYVANNLFGHTETFRKGKIDSWKEELTDSEINHLNKVAGKLMIETGYAENLEPLKDTPPAQQGDLL